MDIHHYFIPFIDVSRLSIEEEGYAAYDDLQQSLVDKDDKGSDQSIYVHITLTFPCIASSSFSMRTYRTNHAGFWHLQQL